MIANLTLHGTLKIGESAQCTENNILPINGTFQPRFLFIYSLFSLMEVTNLISSEKAVFETWPMRCKVGATRTFETMRAALNVPPVLRFR